MNYLKLKNRVFLEKIFQNKCLIRYTASIRASTTTTNTSNKNAGPDYSKTLNLPNAGDFELSMKKICENEEKIKKV